MNIEKFRIENWRNIELAECYPLPPIMIITGPNGCGKSTLLQALRKEGKERPMYIGPHRASRRQQVRFRFLGPKIDMRTVLEGDQLPGYEGIHIMSTDRTPWDIDDAATYLKYSLCQIELDRREAITERYDQNGQIAEDSLPDVWEPLRELAQNLLPHLKFEKIDTTDRDKIQCLWSSHGKETFIDIDDLSSGEKSIIQLFFPLVEHRVKEILQKLRGEVNATIRKALCVLIDEPELHLHPDLQTKILDYFRRLSTRDNAQFIIATHSQTIVENANSDELYLLRPAEAVIASENQLIRVATDDERLDLLREVFGSTSNLTAMRPFLVVEGKQADRQSRRAADARIYSFLSDEFSRILVIPAGGKTECRALVNSLNDILKKYSQTLKAHALLDRDLQEENPTEPTVHLLPVSMIENFLVDPLVIWEATKVVHHKMDLVDEKTVEAAITDILDSLSESETDRRIKASIGVKTFRVVDPVSSLKEQISGFSDCLSEQLSDEGIAAIHGESEKSVAAIKEAGKRREFFHGKTIVEEFYRLYMQQSGMSKEIFIYNCARAASERASVKRFVEKLMTSMGIR